MIKDLETTIQSSTKSAVRVCIATSRYIKKKEELCGILNKSKGALVVICNGDHATVGRHGELLDQFLKIKHLLGLCAKEDKVAYFGDENYETAPVRIMSFAGTYYKNSGNVRNCK